MGLVTFFKFLWREPPLIRLGSPNWAKWDMENDTKYLAIIIRVSKEIGGHIIENNEVIMKVSMSLYFICASKTPFQTRASLSLHTCTHRQSP
jgi:hypothetical protein